VAKWFVEAKCVVGKDQDTRRK